jgi:hypothetical protein
MLASGESRSGADVGVTLPEAFQKGQPREAQRRRRGGGVLLLSPQEERRRSGFANGDSEVGIRAVRPGRVG